jgi:hypothetical protein
MARMVIRVSGQRQKHDASQLGEIAKQLLQFSGDHHQTAFAPFFPKGIERTEHPDPKIVCFTFLEGCSWR